MKTMRLSIISILLLAVAACGATPAGLSFMPSNNLPDYQQDSFAAYVTETQDWLRENRAFLTDQKTLEVDANSPFELRSDTPTDKGLLLVHGLADSPYSFRDIANQLVEQDYIVRVLLLPGHGSRPADLMLPNYEDWVTVVQHHTDLMKKEVDHVWMGGFSTGANLVTDYALKNDDIEGLLLFSPAFQSKSKFMIQLASVVAPIMPWADAEPEDNILRYNSLPTHGAAIYAETSATVQESLEKYGQYDKPVFMALAEDDSVLNVPQAFETFKSRFTHPDSRLFWMGGEIAASPRIVQKKMNLPEQQISTGSHMHALFSPDNPFYGVQGSIRICENGQKPEQDLICRLSGDIWFSHYGYQEKDKSHARLTWNPYFKDMIQTINSVLAKS